ncbi:hypothetical protein [Paramagnetospirillum magneticum]|uniref:Uncharacterized protein n=1 Tax=Paramagnetospirillum magneticum (strain ATCC 700264 / AMB-1) TaxID=342108 RepID=Q2W770_PARM1|nr:hypothetical protein [Paramagnetospirillum magneticum]BAE50305.1 hypothetical protein amb1501 [Paramagnetospirillum magneticum AMB-1]
MSTRRPAAAATDHLFRYRGIVVTFRATALGGGVRVEVIGLDPVAIDEASARLARACAETAAEVRHLSPGEQCRRLEVTGASASAVRAKFAPVAAELEGGLA